HDPLPIFRGAWELFVRVLDTGEPRSDESRLLLPDGTELIVTLAFTRLEDEQGRARGIFGLVTDLTERRRTLEALEESRERYRTLFHSIDEGRSEEHTSELQSRENLVCRLLL